MTNTQPEPRDDMPLTASGKLDGRSARKIETRRRIILAASELFAEKGYEGTSMDEIAEAASVSKGTIFYNFRNKAELFEQLIRHSVTVIADDMAAASDDLPAWDALVESMWRGLSMVDANPAAAQIVLSELFRTQREWADSLVESRAILLEPIVSLFVQLAAEREKITGVRLISADHVRYVSIALVGAVIVAALDHRAFTPERDLREVHRGLVHSIASLNPALALPASTPLVD